MRRKLEDVYCWPRIHAHCRRWRWRLRRRHAPPERKPLPNSNQRPPRALFCLNGQFLLLFSLQLWQQLQRCRQTRARVGLPLFLIHYTPVLRKQFAANDMCLREANSYKRALALRNCRREMLADAAFAVRQFARCSQLPTQSAHDVCRLISSKSYLECPLGTSV